MKKRADYYVERSGCIWAASGFMALSFLVRLFWCIRYPDVVTERGFFVHAVMPLSAGVLFILFLLAFGKKHLWLTFIPAAVGVLFFLLKAATFDSRIHQILCTILYLSVAVLYGLTVFGILPIRRLLIPLFGIPLLYHIFVEDLIINRTVYGISEWLQEGSVLCIMAGLLCVSFGIREGNNG